MNVILGYANIQAIMSKPNILAIDDEISVRTSISEAFSDFYNIIPAENGIQGVERIEEKEIDVILLDLRLPLLENGIKTFKEIRRIRPDIPIIIVTAVEAEGREKLKDYASEIFAYIVKPWYIERLHEIINLALAEKGKGLSDEEVHSQFQEIKKKQMRKEKEDLSKPKTILAVDDEVSILESLGMLLKVFDKYNLIKAFNVEEGLKKYKEFKDKIDMVFVDYMMMGGNGLTLLEEIRKINQEIPVYIMTASPETEEFIKVVAEKGGDNVVFKPFTHELLCEILGEKPLN